MMKDAGFDGFPDVMVTGVHVRCSPQCLMKSVEVSSGVASVTRGVSTARGIVGGLIYTAVGSVGTLGLPPTKRSG